jgi:hypothetical protein
MVWFFSYTQVCFGLVLALSSHHFFSVVTLPLPSPEVVAEGLKTEILAYVQILSWGGDKEA